MKTKSKQPLGQRISSTVKHVIHFITYDIWRITGYEISGPRKIYIHIIKTIILAARGFQSENLSVKASALTYRILLAIVPMLAVLLGIAKGFGFQGAVRQELFKYFQGHEMELNRALSFVESYIDQAQGGVIVGIGLLLLFYTVISLISAVEAAFNDIWQVQKSRPWNRKIIDYMALFLIVPILMTVSSGMSLFITTIETSFLSQYVFLTPIVDAILKIAPFLIVTMIFTALYILLPNTKVHFLNALIAGFVAGSAFQVFQYFYINGQIWVSKYNAIYGSFAAIPLLLLWLQLSWLICLFGAELSYASQNVRKFSFEKDTKTISRRYKDFITLIIAVLIVKRFVNGEKPYSIDELSDEYRIPLGITTKVLALLTEVGIIIEVNVGNQERVTYFQPAMDVNKLTVGYLLHQIDQCGSENFKIDTNGIFREEWLAILKSREDMLQGTSDALLKDL